ncbi:MAG TPA: PEP/pyruvate-binding domain-containing protein [Symbiobacteriaceae bacterium]|jgi:pyruvate,water dikinase
MELIRWFADLGGADLPLAGGKGANLGEMARTGLPVPPGFVLLTPAYQAFVDANGLQVAVAEAAGRAVADGSAQAFEAASDAIRALFDRGAMPPDVAVAVTAAYGQFGDGPAVAVRSSATAEDLPGASFAGQQETYLNIHGPAAVLAAVQRCWSSLWTARALAYRARQGIGPEAVALAVVVQRLIPAEAAGVLFTANPVTGRRDQVAIDGAWGLGEAVVSGQVTPDHWVADGATGRTLEAHIASKALMTVRTDLGTETREVPPELQERPVLDAAGVAALVDLGRRAAAHFGSPQDLEWAQAGGTFYLVQSRPITSLFPDLEPPVPSEAGYRAFISLNLMQGIVEPLTPAGRAMFHKVALGAAIKLLGIKLPPGLKQSPALRFAGGRMYGDVTNGVRYPLTRKFLLAATPMIDGPMGPILAALLDREPERLPPDGKRPVHPAAKTIAVVIGRALTTLAFPEASRERGLARVKAQVEALERRAGAVQGLAERLRFAEEVPSNLLSMVMFSLLPVLASGMGNRYILEAKLKQWFGEAALLQKVLRALPHNPTTEMDLALWRLSRQLKAEGAEPAADHPGVQAFLAKYGHRGVREIDVGMPRWSDDPTHVLTTLSTYLTHGEQDDPEVQFRRGAVEAEEAARAIVARVRREKGSLRAFIVRGMLRRIRALVGIREYPKFYAVRTIAAIRSVLGGAGAELVAAGRLDQADDIYFLDFADWDREGDLRAIAAANRAEYDREVGRKSTPRVITSEGEAFYAAPVSAEGALVGTPASAGVYEGPARVIMDPRGAKLEPGEVLVAPGTDPAWTPLFLSAGALVMEVGGMMSHGSVVAREYGIPAVVGVAGATAQIKTGQRVRVDGETGRVIPL